MNSVMVKKLILGCLVIGIGIVTWFGIELYRFARLPAGSTDSQEIVTVMPGENFISLADMLKRKGIITDTRKFKLLAIIRRDDKNLKAGEYPLSASMTPGQVLDVLVDGKTFLYRLTVPEGFNIEQIAAVVAETGLGAADDFATLCMDADFTASIGIGAQTLEGYLFPDTYYFPKGVQAETIIGKMVARFKEQFSPAWRQRSEELNMSVHEIVTLASIIEKETGEPSERPVIASVFHNRLKKRMRLESDPTVIYGITDFDGNIKRTHLTTLTPYNTYKIKGLPPGPIANPGRAAIEAALYPAQTDYLFFVSKKDNTHHFSKTIQEHNAAVRKYQLRRPRRPSS